jgi:hypothetical protein
LELREPNELKLNKKKMKSDFGIRRPGLGHRIKIVWGEEDFNPIQFLEMLLISFR